MPGGCVDCAQLSDPQQRRLLADRQLSPYLGLLTRRQRETEADLEPGQKGGKRYAYGFLPHPGPSGPFAE